MATQLIDGRFRGEDAAGLPLVGGMLYTYVSGTTTPKTAYTDATLGVAATNPLVLNARGEVQVWLGTGAYSLKLTDPAGVTIWTTDGIIAPDVAGAGQAAADALESDLASDTAGKGASKISVQDSAGLWVGATVEAVLAEAGARLSSLVTIPAGGALAAVVAANPAAQITLPPSNLSVAAVQLTAGGLIGAGSGLSKLTASSTTQVLKLGYANTPSQWAYKRITDLTIDGNGRASDGVSFDNSVSRQISGRWILDGVVFVNCRKGVEKTSGNISNRFQTVEFAACDYGYYAVGQTSPLMHAGCDVFEQCHFVSIDKAAIYIDSPQIGTGGTRISNSVLEFCPGIAVFVKNWADSFTPLTLDNAWFEGNGSAGTVNINGTNYSTVDIHLENTRQAVILNGHIPKVRFLNSHVACHDVAMNADATTWAIDSTSTVTVDGANIDGGGHPVVINSLSTIRRVLGNFTSRFQAPPRWIKAGATEAAVVQSIPFTSAQTYVGTGTVAGTVVTDGRSYSTCNELVVPAGFSLFPPAVTVTAGKWYLVTVDYKLMSGAAADLVVSVEDSVQIAPGLQALFFGGQWATVAAIGPCGTTGTVRLRSTNSGSGSLVVRMGALQIVEFDTERRAIEYYNAGFHQ